MAIPLRLLALALLLGASACSDGGGSSGLGVLTDGDGDGLPDTLEARIGSDARDPDSPVRDGANDVDTPDGPGPDALPDGLERWLRANGAPTPITARTDSDGDGVPDHLEVASGLDPFDDDDPLPLGSGDLAGSSGPANDGISDALESYLARRGARLPVTAASDTDADGIPDVLEARSGSDPFDALDPPYMRAFDLDGDQVSDWLELASGSDPLSADFPVFDGADDDADLLGPPGDGLLDGLEGWLHRGGAAAPVTTATDTDGDGAPDATEVRAGSDPFDATRPLASGAADRDRDGIPDALEELLLAKGARTSTRTTDSDGDGVPDFAEAAGGSDPFDPRSPTLFARVDLDGDGIDDFLELEEGSDRLDPASPLADGAEDADDATGPARDPISDALEALLVARGSTAPVTTYSDADGDGVPDLVELRFVSDPLDASSPVAFGARDSDGDGLTDAVEHVLGPGPGAAGAPHPARNSDSDAIPDAIELLTGSDWRDGSSPRPGRSTDADGDGALDHLELALGTDPLSADDPVPAGGTDADGDGLSDALEQLLLASGTPAPVSPASDSDGDGLADHLEVELASDRHDGDHPLVAGGLDVVDRTGPAGDGLSDALEHYLVAGGARPPVTTRSDTDGDELPDYLEVALAYGAFDADSPLEDGSADDDGDGVSNALELVLERLGAAAPVDGRTDSDADGAPDHLEVFAGADAFDGDSPLAGGALDGDGDGLSDALEHVLVVLGARAPVTTRSDTDGDGVPDLYEVRSGTHPLRGDHPLPDGGLDVVGATGPADGLSDALEHLLIAQGASAPVTRASESDADGAPDHLEVLAGSWPFDADEPVPGGPVDADGDRMPDALEEVLVRLGAVPPLDTRNDTDDDGAGDHFEVLTGAHPLDPDVPVALGAGGRDVHDPTGPAGDRISDALELLLVGIGCVPPIRATNDVDGDGLPDWFEARSGTGVLDGDSPAPGGGVDTDDAGGPAGDGMSDALEAFLIANGATGPVTVETDTDGDGVPDYFEVFKGSDPFDPLDAIPPGTRPAAAGLAVTGVPFEGRTLTGSYVYVDAELDPEGETTFRWLRDGVPIAGETAVTHEVAAADLGTTLTFEVTPVSRLAYPPETALGLAHPFEHAVPVPSFPRGDGGPGGVGLANGAGDVRAWLSAEAGVETAGGEVTAWRDRSGWGRDATEISAARRPALVEDAGPNATRALRFDGASHLALPRPVERDFTLVAAFATTSSAGNGSWWLSPAILGGESPPPCVGDYHLGINNGKPLFVVSDAQLTTSNPFANGAPHVLEAQRTQASGRMRLFVDGRVRGSLVGATDVLDCPAILHVGSSTAADGFWTGDLFELCAFDRSLGTAERELVGAALAVRWGTPAGAAAYDAAATHAGDVAGIGRDSATDLVVAAEGPGILRVSNATRLSDGDYLVWGTDLPDDFTLAGDVPSPYPKRLRRTWAWTVTDGGAGDGVGRVDLRFRVAGLFLSRRAQDFALLVDDDTDLSDARVHPSPGVYDPALDTIEFQDVELGPERHFGLAVVPL